MKHLILLFLISMSFQPRADAADLSGASINELLSQVDVSHPSFGKDTFGSPIIDVFKGIGDTRLLSYQARYGGDGEHTENILKLFSFKGDEVKKILDQNIDSVQFELDKGVLKAIKGRYVETLCDVCDGWDASEPDDIFFIPINIDIKTLSVKAELTKQEKNKLLSRLEKQSKKTTAEQLSYGNRSYPEYVEAVRKRIISVLN